MRNTALCYRVTPSESKHQCFLVKSSLVLAILHRVLGRTCCCTVAARASFSSCDTLCVLRSLHMCIFHRIGSRRARGVRWSTSDWSTSPGKNASCLTETETSYGPSSRNWTSSGDGHGDVFFVFDGYRACRVVLCVGVELAAKLGFYRCSVRVTLTDRGEMERTQVCIVVSALGIAIKPCRLLQHSVAVVSVLMTRFVLDGGRGEAKSATNMSGIPCVIKAQMLRWIGDWWCAILPGHVSYRHT